MPGSAATLTTCSSERSAARSGSSARVAYTTPGTSIRPCRGITKRYGACSTTSTSGHLPPAPGTDQASARA